MWHHALLGILGLIAIGGIIALLVVNSGGPSRLARPRPAAGARIGSSFLTKDALGNTYRVRLDRLIDPATGVNTTPAAGSRLVGAVYTITGVSGSPQGENVITNASLLSTSGHIYRAFAGRVAGYGNFSNGTVRVSPGTSETGAATYQIPNGVRLAQAQWAAAAGHGVISRWTLP